jgi:hypothetical protein
MSIYGPRQHGGIGSSLLDAASRNPEGLLLLGAGAALLLRGGRHVTSRSHQAQNGYRESEMKYRSEYRNGGHEHGRDGGMLHAAGEKVSESISSVGESAAAVRDAATSYASSATGYVSDTARSLASQTGHLAERAHETIHENVSDLQHRVSAIVQQQPMTVALAGLAAGALVAAAFRPTSIERRALGDTFEQAAGYVARTGEQLMEATSKASERLMESANDRGLNKEGLKDVVGEAAGAFAEALQEPKKNDPGAGRKPPV